MSPLALAALAVLLTQASALASLLTQRRPTLMRHLVMPLLGASGAAALAGGLGAVSYTHLTLPTKRIV